MVPESVWPDLLHTTDITDWDRFEDWASHGMEHELSAWDTTITHGEGLAVVVPAWMKYVWHANPNVLSVCRNVMGVKARY